MAIDSVRIGSEDAMHDILLDRSPGDTIKVVFRQRGTDKTARLVLVEDPRMEIVTYEEAGLEVTPEMEAFRQRWLGPR